MKLIASLLLTLCLSFGIRSSYAAIAPVETEQAASAIAEAAFLNYTKHTVGDYSVHPGKHTPTEWHFLISGEKRFLRPGNHWDISVNRATGATKIVDGL